MTAPTPPVPVSATWLAIPQLILVTFDKPLVPAVYDERNWRAVVDRFERDPTGAQVFAVNPARVRITTVPGDPNLDPDTVTYLGNDLVGQNGRFVVPFANFPVVF